MVGIGVVWYGMARLGDMFRRVVKHKNMQCDLEVMQNSELSRLFRMRNSWEKEKKSWMSCGSNESTTYGYDSK